MNKHFKLFEKIIEIESIHKSNKNAKLNGLGEDTKWSN